MDTYTRKHLESWLHHNVSEHSLPPLVDMGLIASVLAAVWSEDPDYWSSQGWPRVWNEARDSNPEIIPYAL